MYNTPNEFRTAFSLKATKLSPCMPLGHCARWGPISSIGVQFEGRRGKLLQDRPRHGKNNNHGTRNAPNESAGS